MVWESDGKAKIIVAGETIEVDKPVQATKIKEIAKKYGIVKFDVRDEQGNSLAPSDFPNDSDVLIIKEINEAK